MPLRAHSISAMLVFTLFVALTSGCKDFRSTIKSRIIPPSNPTAGSYDLEAISLTYTPQTIKVGDKVVFSKSYKNVGRDKINARTYEVDLEVDGKIISFDHGASELSPGCTVKCGAPAGLFHWQPTKSGTYLYKFTVDTKNTVFEVNEANNCITGTITVTP